MCHPDTNKKTSSQEEGGETEGETAYKISILSHRYPVWLFLSGDIRSDEKRSRVPYLWPRMARHQTGELQGFSLSDGVDSLRVPLLFDITGVTWVDNADSRRCCGREGEKKKKKHKPR